MLYRLLQHLQHELGIDISHGHVAEDRICVGGQSVAPLLLVLGVLPAGLLGSISCSAHSSKVVVRASASRFWAAAASLSAMGSFPASRCWRASLAFWRASASDTLGKLPSPMSWALPSRLNRKTHDLLPVADTCR